MATDVPAIRQHQPSETTAFGLRLETDLGIPIPELRGRSVDGVRPRCSLVLGACGPAPGEPIFEIREGDDVGLRLWQRSPQAYLLTLREYGSFEIDATEASIICEPTGPLRWQDALVAQALPLAAVMLGLEVFHASAVVDRDGLATLIIAPSGTGKSTLAAYIAASGLALLADDAVAVSLDPDGTPVAHAGSRWVQLSAADAGVITTGDTDAAIVGERAGKTTVQFPDSVATGCPIGNLILLSRDPNASEPSIERNCAVSPPELLGNSLTQTIRTPRRLIHQLDVCAAIAERVAVARVSFGSATGPAVLARELTSALALA